MVSGQEKTATAYANYRAEHKDLREAKRFFGVETDELKLSLNAVKVLEARYLLKDDSGKVVETPKQMFRRVAREIAAVEAIYGGDVKASEEEFYRMMTMLEFLPNSPTLMNAGTRMGQLSACFVLPVEDSMEGIFDSLKHMAIIHQSGGGTGFSFSRLRPKGDMVGSTKCEASGPVSFMKVFDVATDVIKQGGRRRGANIGILRVDHPDILEFIGAKQDPTVLRNFNISVAVTDRFMKAVQKGQDIDLMNPRTGKRQAKFNAKDIFRFMALRAWHNGDPGMIFIDEINRHNPTPALGDIESTNPCGEQPLLPYESCNLGSINLGRFAGAGKNARGRTRKKSEIDWERLEKVVRLGVRFLDNVIDASRYPLKTIEDTTKANRKIGLGVMGFADMLIRLGIPYDSKKAVETAGKVMKFIDDKAKAESVELGKERGSFPNINKSKLKGKPRWIRNASITTIAPTGTISIIAGCSSGIEPLFGVSFVRNVLGGAKFLETNEDFKRMAEEQGVYSKELMMQIAKTGTLKESKLPQTLKRLFVTSTEISPEWHVKVQAEFQKYTDAAVSKTINFPNNAEPKDVEDAFLLAYKLKCKGITVYRYGSREDQVLTFKSKSNLRYMKASSEYAGGCPSGECPF
ncbi:TPA: adenosylcobalamin-dependent ribonucleoside-diphosphate reductase [Candidatus Woesearchaeota archaeon]|nr:adenosylcobalamin-dependent ribonucleoside-diphosphate reductase [Candidatus Woesearchaeota archaeon]